jgi:hypothetical protein
MLGHNSTYHSMQVSVDKRYSHGFTINSSYTWAKNLDYSSRNGFGGSRGINNPFNFFSPADPPTLPGQIASSTPSCGTCRR